MTHQLSIYKKRDEALRLWTEANAEMDTFLSSRRWISSDQLSELKGQQQELVLAEARSDTLLGEFNKHLIGLRVPELSKVGKK